MNQQGSIELVSPDRGLTCSIEPNGRYTLAVVGNASWVDELELEEQIEELLSKAMSVIPDEIVEMNSDRERSINVAVARTFRGKWLWEEYQRRCSEKLRTLRVENQSREGDIRVEIHGDGDAVVNIRKGTLRRRMVSGIIQELNEIVHSARYELATISASAFRAIDHEMEELRKEISRAR